jgi:hypothetical protein
MLIDRVKNYLASSIKEPYFLFIDDDLYRTAMEELAVLGFDSIKLSDFCRDEDKLPNIDELFSFLKTVNDQPNVRKFAVKGLGEYLALRGTNEASQVLSRIKNLAIGEAKVVLLIRGLSSLIAGLQTDPRFDKRRHIVVGNGACDLSFILFDPSVGLASSLSGFKKMLAKLENGFCGEIVVRTGVNIAYSLFTVHEINNVYEGVKFFVKDFDLPRSCGNDDRWAEFLAELEQSNGSLDEVFDNHGLAGNLESDFYARAAGNNYLNWLYFICLKCKADTLPNGYLRFVLEMTNRFEDFTRNALDAIIEIPHSEKRFPGFYAERKRLVEKFPESEIANFVINNRRVTSESIFRLTDNTKAEREEIIAWISKNGTFPNVSLIYPSLADYLRKYIFKCPELADVLTDYFEAYKRQKVLNIIERDFLLKVEELAHGSRKFNQLPTRNETIEGLDKTETYLYWLDALGVEYLGFIEALVRQKGLSFRVEIVRSELPSITSVNRDFFDSWQGHKEKNNELDDVKHNDAGGYNFTNNELPIHLAKELDIIKAVVEKAATELGMRRCRRFLIASDHGASRLAVLHRKEEKYETNTKGEHSGRCCKFFQPYDLPFAAEENGYLVLADYGRFKGSRAANVEVHGGASLEEVVVPLIELSLKDERITVKLVNDVVTVDYRTGTEIELFFNSTVQNVSMVLNEKSYPATQIDSNHFAVKLPDINKAGEYSAEVYAGDNMIGRVLVKTQGKSAKVNGAFDDLF